MDLDQALLSYRARQFTDQDVMRCTHLSLRAWRTLLGARALNTVSERLGRGRVRLCDETVFKRAAAIAAINRSGLSLEVSGQIAYFMPFHTLLFTACDPLTILRQHFNDGVADTVRSRVAQPTVDWFDPKKSAKAEAGTDWMIEIYEGRFVGAIYGATDRRVIFGDLRDQGATFVAWHPSHSTAQVTGTAIEKLARKALNYHRFADYIEQYEDPTQVGHLLDGLGYKSEKHESDDPLRLVAEGVARNPLFTTTINVTLAIRKALRRYLGMEAAEPSSEATEP